jgi:multidrug efflux pump subunit AcrA (membrane-fusion protein)
VDAITAAMKVISTAENAVQNAEDEANFSTAPGTALNLQAAAEAVLIAESDVTAATVSLATLTSVDTSAKSSALVIAEAELDEAQSHLTDITTTDETLVALRTSERNVARAQLDNAIEVLGNSVLNSPVDGIVDLVNFDEGDEVPRTAVIVEIIDPSVVTVEMDVAQVDILAVAIGAEASLTLDALPGQILTGVVTDIGAASGGQQGTVTFPVVVTMQVPPGIALIEGLTANAQMITSTRSNVLLVPSVAVGGSFTRPSIDVVRDGEIRTVNVSLDGGNDTFAVIGAGVVEGDVVLFRLPGVTEDTNPFNVIRAGIGGGFTGGFPRSGGGGGGGGGGFPGGGGGQQR